MRGASVTDGTQRAWLRAAALVCLNFILAVTAVLLLWATFRDGVAHGRDARLSPFGMGHFANAVCAILSIEKYATGRYVCASAAQNGMKAVGLYFDDDTLARIHMSLPEWLQNTEFLNEALKAAFAASPLPWDGSVLSIGWGQDAGYQDFIQFAFLTFGPKIQALYYGFFLLLILSSGLYVLQFYKRPFALFVVTVALYAIYDFFHSFLSIFHPGLNNPRTLTFLVLIPLLHAMFLILYRDRPSPTALLLFIPQAVLIAASGDFVDLSYWVVIAISAMSLLVIGNSWWRHSQPLRQSCLRCWPTVALVGCVALAMVATATTTDPRLARMGGMRLHSFWEPMFYDLQLNPEWQTRYAGHFRNATGDVTTTVAVELYLKEHPIPDNSRDYIYRNKRFGLRQLAFEKYTRLSYMQFALNDPRYILKLKYQDLKATANTLIQSVARALLDIDRRFALLALGIAFATIFEARRKPKIFLLVTGTTASLLLFALVAAAPNWIIVPEIEVMGGPFVVALLAGIIAAVWTVVAAGLAIIKATSALRCRLAVRRDYDAGGLDDSLPQ